MGNPNLDRHMAEINRALTEEGAKGTHVHAAVRVGIGNTNAGPVKGWEYTPQDEGYGWIELVNYRGDVLRKPLTDVILYDIRPCRDHGCYDRA